jgi:hypothetical protein
MGQMPEPQWWLCGKITLPVFWFPCICIIVAEKYRGKDFSIRPRICTSTVLA